MGSKNSKLVRPDPSANPNPNLIFNDECETFHGRAFAGSDQWKGLGLLYRYSTEQGSFTAQEAEKLKTKMRQILDANSYLMGRIVLSTDPEIQPKRYQLELHPENLRSENYVIEQQDEFLLNQKNNDSSKILETRNARIIEGFESVYFNKIEFYT